MIPSDSSNVKNYFLIISFSSFLGNIENAKKDLVYISRGSIFHTFPGWERQSVIRVASRGYILVLNSILNQFLQRWIWPYSLKSCSSRYLRIEGISLGGGLRSTQVRFGPMFRYQIFLLLWILNCLPSKFKRFIFSWTWRDTQDHGRLSVQGTGWHTQWKMKVPSLVLSPVRLCLRWHTFVDDLKAGAEHDGMRRGV